MYIMGRMIPQISIKIREGQVEFFYFCLVWRGMTLKKGKSSFFKCSRTKKVRSQIEILAGSIDMGEKC